MRVRSAFSLREQAATEAVSQCGETAALGIFEPQAMPDEPSFQETVFFAKEPNHVGLLTMEPAGQGCEQQLEREHARSLRHGSRSSCGTLRR
jgi:hypothetical protein